MYIKRILKMRVPLSIDQKLDFPTSCDKNIFDNS